MSKCPILNSRLVAAHGAREGGGAVEKRRAGEGSVGGGRSGGSSEGRGGAEVGAGVGMENGQGKEQEWGREKGQERARAGRSGEKGEGREEEKRERDRHTAFPVSNARMQWQTATDTQQVGRKIKTLKAIHHCS